MGAFGPDPGPCAGRCGPDDVFDLADYVFDTSPGVSGALLRDTDVPERLAALLTPSAALDGALSGYATRVHRRAARPSLIYISRPAEHPFSYSRPNAHHAPARRTHNP